MLTKAILALTFIINISTIGCIEPSGDNSETVIRAIIRPGPDGRIETISETISVVEQQAEIAARKSFVASSKREGGSQNLLFETGCGFSNNDLWLFDQPNLTGNQLCISKGIVFTDDTIFLSQVSRTIFSSWAFAVRSLWAGIDDGFLVKCDEVRKLCFSNIFLNFAPFQRFDSLGTLGSQLNVVTLPP